MAHRFSFVLVAVAGFVLAPALVHAQSSSGRPAVSPQDDELARNHFESGRAYFSRARYEDAAREFAEAYRLSHRLPMLLNLSRAYEEADRDEEAIAALDEWLRLSPAEDPGRNEVTERRTRLSLELEARRAAAANANIPAETPVATATPAAEPQAQGTTLRTLSFVALGVGGASLATSLATGLRAHSIHRDLTSRCDPTGDCPADAAGDIRRGRALARTSTATTFIGAAAAAGGLVMLLVTGHDDEPASRVTYAPYVGPGVAGADLHLRF